jgi:hypothetical protein
LFPSKLLRDTGAVKRGIFLFLLFARIVLPLHADAAALWSPVQSGLQARLFISPARSADYAYGISIEFYNGLENSLAIGVDMPLNFSRDDLVVTVRDDAGHIIKPSPPPMLDELVPGWSWRLPAYGRISFPIGRGGGTPLQGQGQGKSLSFGGDQQWILPPTGGPFRISATLYSDLRQAMRAQAEAQGRPLPEPPNPGEPRRRSGELHGGWQGTLDLPPIELPQN